VVFGFWFLAFDLLPNQTEGEDQRPKAKDRLTRNRKRGEPMKRLTLIITVIAGLSVTALLFAQNQTPRTTTRAPQAPVTRMTNEQRFQKTITTQQRINRYFHNDVIPKLRNCWNRVEGAGTIQINHRYARNDNGKWIAQELTIGNSTLPRGQEAVALRCMQEAVRGSSFPSVSDDETSKEYMVKWTWPVPFPANAEEQTRVMFASKGSLGAWGCGNVAPNCVDCANTGTACIDVCSGYHYCKLAGGGCQASYRCTTGNAFEVAGRTIMY
jgi:hypothetical protein